MTYNLAKDWDIKQLLKIIAETGYQTVELRTTHAHGGSNAYVSRTSGCQKRFEDWLLNQSAWQTAFYHSPSRDELKISRARRIYSPCKDVRAKE